MAVYFQRTPLRASTYRGLQVGSLVVGVASGLFAAALSASWGGLILVPAIWFILLYSLRVWYAEPAIDEWDKIPREVRIAMLNARHAAALQLGEYDRDRDVRKLWRTILFGR